MIHSPLGQIHTLSPRALVDTFDKTSSRDHEHTETFALKRSGQVIRFVIHVSTEGMKTPRKTLSLHVG